MEECIVVLHKYLWVINAWWKSKPSSANVVIEDLMLVFIHSEEPCVWGWAEDEWQIVIFYKCIKLLNIFAVNCVPRSDYNADGCPKVVM